MPSATPLSASPDVSPHRVLVAAGEHHGEHGLAETLAEALRREGWEVSIAGSGAAAVALARELRPDAVVLDPTLPGLGGVEVLSRLRTDALEATVLLLTGREPVQDRVAGLTAGGDDHVTKPFRVEEVVARLRKLVHRAGTALADPKSQLHVGDLILDEDSREVFRGGEEISLTATEFELLSYLMRNPRQVLSKAQILNRVWSNGCGVQANVVELYISYLRKKVDAGRAPMIHTMRGAGYVLRPAS